MFSRTPIAAALLFALASTGCSEPAANKDSTVQTAAAAAAANADKSTATTAAVSAENPLLKPSPLQYQYPEFDKIKDEHYLPAFTQGMSEHLAEIDKIANNTEAATFDNTIVAMEKAGQLLSRTATMFFNVSGANTNDTLDKVSSEIAPKLAAHQDQIYLNAALFARVKALFDGRDALGLDAESKRLVEQYYADFVRSGALLTAEQKVRIQQINSELASLQDTFSQNVLKEVNASALVVETKEELAGLSDDAIAAAAEEAKSRNLAGKYVLTLQNTSTQPALAALTNRATRQKLLTASLQRGSHGGEFDNSKVLTTVARLRAERASILGFPHFAAESLQNQTAKTAEAVNERLAGIAPAAVANAKKEAAELQAMIKAEGGDFELAAWDWSFYTEKVRKAKYEFDESQLKPYFEMNNVLENGVFYAATQLYGITFKERKDLPVYHPDVRVFEIFDADGSSMGFFLADMYARASKQGGAWMNAYVSQSGLMGTKPVIANHLNIPKPANGQPTLMTFDEVTTTFHEFGHALHGLFSNVKYPYFSGTAVPRDFVEYPSQVNEMWAVWPEILKNYAKHYQTGEAMPQALLDKVFASAKFNQGHDTTAYLAAALLDQSWHQLKPEQVPVPEKLLEFEAQALKKAGVDFPPVPPRYRSTYFSHIVGGYAAGYYAYIWSEVLDADTVEWFKENGGLSRKNGDHFRATLLSRGGSEDAMTVFKQFRGKEPDINALLIRRGLK